MLACAGSTYTAFPLIVVAIKMTDEEQGNQFPGNELHGVHEFDDGTENFYSGAEPFFAAFSQTNVDLNTCRLTINDRVLYPLSDLASQIENTRREFMHTGDAHSALQEVIRVKSQFDQRAQSWEREIQGLERDKRGQSGGAIQRMKSEIARVRGRVSVTGRTVMKLEITLNQLAIEMEDAKKADSSNEGAPPLSGSETVEFSGENAVEQIDDQVTGDGNDSAVDEYPLLSRTTRKKIDAIREVIASLVGSGLRLSYADANRRVTGASQGREQAWEKGLPLVLAVGWYQSDEDEGPTDMRLLKVWLIAKSPSAADALVAAANHTGLFLTSDEACDRTLEFTIAADRDPNLPRSESIRKFVERLIEERFSNSSEHPFMSIVASCNSFPLSETELILKTKRIPSSQL